MRKIELIQKSSFPILLALLFGWVAIPSLAQANNAAVKGYCLSVNFGPGSATFGATAFTTYYTTYDGSTSLPLYDVVNGLAVFSGESSPVTGQVGVYRTDYVLVANGSVAATGSISAIYPTTDLDNNGAPDFLQDNQNGSVGFSGTATKEVPAPVVVATFTGQLTRPSGTYVGSYVTTVQDPVAGPIVYRGTTYLINANGSIVYDRRSNTLTLSTTVGNADGSVTAYTGSATFVVVSTDRVSFPEITLTGAASRTIRLLQFSLSRSGKRYTGDIELQDGGLSTTWRDYTKWRFEVTDQNDSDGNGVPDLTDSFLAPTITQLPVGRSLLVGQPLELTVGAAGTQPLLYQWHHAGTNLPNAKSAIYSVAAASDKDAGAYAVTVANAAGSKTTSEIFVVVNTVFGQDIPQTVYVWPMATASQNIMIASLAGIVNRNTSGEMLLSLNNNSLPNPLFWLNQLKAAYPQVQSQFQSSPIFFINRYRAMLSGYVLYDRAVNIDSINIATSIAGVTSALIVDPSTLSYAVAAGLPLVADARTMTYIQAYTQYRSRFNRTMLFYQDTAQNEQLRDYSIMNHGFMFYADPTALNPYAANQDHQGRIYGWGPSVYDLLSQGSQDNQEVVASNWSWSSSTTSKWKVPLSTQPYHAPINVATQTGKHYVAFVMSDGDNVQALTGGWATDPKWFGSPYRGTFNMTWDLTSTLAEMNPVAFNYYYQNASNGTQKDCFVSASGAGTVFPSQYTDNAGLVASISKSMKLADQKVVSILDPTYDTSTLYPILDDPQVMGMMFKTYDSYYKGRDGTLDWHNGKPILSVKYSLWDGADTALSMANALNTSTHRDGLNDSASYSIVNVHPWSTLGPTGRGTGDPMSNLNQLVQWLDPTKVEVVTLEELIVHLRNNFGAPLYFRFDTNVGSLTPSNGLFQIRLIAPPGRNVIVDASPNLQIWTPIKTNAVPPEGLTLSVPLSQNQCFRARLAP